MNWDSVEGVARALLYEGYLLYPYRKSSIKNAKRWAFGSLFPKAWAERAGERSGTSVEVLVTGKAPSVAVRAVFLVWCERVAEGEPTRLEAVERSVDFGPAKTRELVVGRRVPFAFGAESWVDGAARFATRAIEGFLELELERLGTDVARLHVRLENASSSGDGTDEDEKLRALASAHLLLGVSDGAFASQLDPPAELTGLTRACRSDGVWPVLVGDPGRRDRMLASAIIVYDFPALAAESGGDWFDATEIDEMLALRVRTLSDAEKREVSGGDPRAAAILARSEALGANDFSALHGARRDPEPRPGDQVRVPRGRRDAFDLLLDGELATVLSIEEDFEGKGFEPDELEPVP